MAKSTQGMVNTMLDNIPEKTGKTVEEWLGIITHCGLEKHGQIVTMLKSDHGMTHGYANLLTHMARKSDEPVDLVAAQYCGAKAGLKPIYNALVKIASGFGKDVEIAPRKTCVNLARGAKFAVITPATKTRVDVGINLKGHAGTERLKTEKPGSMCTHKTGLTSMDQIDDELIGWLRQAYDRRA